MWINQEKRTAFVEIFKLGGKNMLLSLSLIFPVGMFLGWLCKKLHLPSLLGMLLTGIMLGPYVLNLIDSSLLTISADIRKIALIIILTRAGLSLNIDDLKKVGRPAILMCFVPACFELMGTIILAPKILNISILDAAILGSVIAAVSPAVIVPKMVKLMEEGYGTKKGIPQLILAGASVDDVFVIVMFSAFTGLATGNKVDIMEFVKIPVSIITGIIIGLFVGYCFGIYFKKFHVRDTVKIILLLSISFLLVTAEDKFSDMIPFSSLISIMCIGIMIHQKRKEQSVRLSTKFNKLWVGAEVLLFVFVGATVDTGYIKSAGLMSVLLIFGVLLFRMAGVFVCLIKTKLNKKERLFCMIAYTPKATVQAAIGGIPLAMGLSCGNIVLTVAVISILLTAPLGAFIIENTYKRLLEKNNE